MKKSQLAVAVCAVIIAAASFAGAEGRGVDFDKGSFNTADFMEAIKTSDVPSADNVGNIPSVPVTVTNTLNIKVYKLAASSLQKLRKEVLNMPGLSKEFPQQINEEKTVVLYNESNVLLTTLAGNAQYVILESNDQKLVDFLAKEKMKAPQQEFSNKSASLVWKCITKYETIMKWVNHVWTSVQISREVCSWQNDVPPQSTALPGGSGSTWNSGQGGDSNYDVNKHLK